jgi:hypothetical protein
VVGGDFACPILILSLSTHCVQWQGLKFTLDRQQHYRQLQSFSTVFLLARLSIQNPRKHLPVVRSIHPLMVAAL